NAASGPNPQAHLAAIAYDAASQRIFISSAARDCSISVYDVGGSGHEAAPSQRYAGVTPPVHAARTLTSPPRFLHRLINGHASDKPGIRSLAWECATDSSILASGGDDACVNLWRIGAKGQEKATTILAR